MKKTLIALAVSSMAMSISAQAENQFYGKMNVSLQNSSADTAGDLHLVSHASRLGVKGSEDLGGSKVIYQAEYEIAVDSGFATDEDDGTDTDTNTLKPRDTFIGLVYEGMGTIKMGVMDTPLKKSQGKFDLFNDVFDIKNVFDGEKRLGNSLNYTTEEFGAIQASVSYVMMESSTLDDGISANVIYSEGPLYAALAMDSKTEDADTSTLRATVIYNMGDLTVGGLVNTVDKTDTADAELGFAVNAAMKMDANTAKVQFESSDQNALGKTSITLGVDHKLAKATKAYAYLNLSDADAANSDVTTLAFGLEHKF